MIPLLRCSVALALFGASAALFAQQGWTVKPEWVRAHESFLSSDVLAGRGSATRDEELTATYVASEFESYGLKFAPGMTSYIQGAEVVSPELDGHATLAAGDASLKEGDDFVLLFPSGANGSGPLKRIAATEVGSVEIAPGTAVLLTGAANMKVLMPAMQQMRRQGASLILIPEAPKLAALREMFAPKTRFGFVRLAEDAPRKTASILLVRAEAASRLPVDGATVTVTVHELPSTTPRQTFNAIGYLQGTDPNAGTLLLSAHLDHLGVGRPVNGASIYNGANDDAAGPTAVMELAETLEWRPGQGPRAGRGASPAAQRAVCLLRIGRDRHAWVDILRTSSAGSAEGPGGQPGVRNDRQPGSQDGAGGAFTHWMGAVQPWAGAEGAWRTGWPRPVSRATFL